MKLHEIMKETTGPAVLCVLINEYFADLDEVEKYLGVYRTLEQMQPYSNSLLIYIDADGPEAHIYPDEQNARFCQASWADWLGAEVDCDDRELLSDSARVVAVCITAMTEFGWSDEETVRALLGDELAETILNAS